ncbi:MAG: MSHA biogenesis protein MshL [Gammaproteobacteria bacterium]|jgi:MSHA biogenesis protein MshL
MQKIILISSLAILSFLTACSEIEPKPFVPSEGHIDAKEQASGDIPELVTQAPVLPAPAPAAKLEKYTVVVNEVPVKELLFALARDAQINVDIDPVIEGVVTINAIDQSLPQILDRLARQVDLRYELSGDTLYIQPDEPFLRTYIVDYVNMSRDMESSNTIATQISSTSGGDSEGGGGGGNNSTTDVTSTSNHHFWPNLVAGISAILGEEATSGSSGDVSITNTVIPNPESGIIAVRATASQHEKVQEFVDNVVGNAKRQVLVQATIVEVTLSDRYQAGIDWSFLNQAGKAGINFVSTALGATAIAPALLSSFVVTATDPNTTREQSLTATISLLDEFGNAKVLSSPQVMTLNNQTALLKVVENFVYFEIDAETTAGVLGAAPITTVDTTVKTVPVGIVMTVTPQIDSGGVITLNVRPTISRVARVINDPNPNIVAPLVNPVPVIAVREMESMLRLTDGQIGVLGGLMTDETQDKDAGLPGAKDVSFLGNLFKSKSAEYVKTELVIFLRPVLIRDPSLTGDLADYQQYLDNNREFATQETEPESR